MYFNYQTDIFFGLTCQEAVPKKMHRGKPEIFSGFLHFSPFFSLFQKSKNSQNKKISFEKND